MFIEVAFPLPLNRTFHYRLPTGSQPNGSVLGKRVLAPFGKKTLVGYVVGTLEETPAFPTKPIHSWLDSTPLLDETLLELARWMSETYLCTLGESLATILPQPLRPPKRIPKPKGVEPKLETHPREAVRLSVEQKDVLGRFIAAVDDTSYHPFLLRGITDSGKTELYVRTIDRVLEQGRQALFLLPEIALTPPFIEKLKTRYSEADVGMWHSNVSAGERYQTWVRVQRGDIRVLLGARSAVFAPFPRLGVIIMDEEHESSYKQEEKPRYHARDVALWRAEKAKAVLIMGSATPSLESYWNAKKDIYTLVELTSRVEMRQLPSVTLIDRSAHATKEEIELPQGQKPVVRVKRRPALTVFSEPMKLAIEQRLARREQVILFVNRRGFTPFLRCSRCGWVARCSRCSMTMALHMNEIGKEGLPPRLQGKGNKFPVPADAFLQCHSCLRTEPVPIQCPTCKAMHLGYFGIGTQRVEQEVKEIFPFAKVARLDRDIGHYRRVYENVYRAFASRQLDVLVGTQIIAKGFDFPGVTLVGVVDADVSLHLPDFRSAERTFQLMAQVAGRTGRGEGGGKVLVQTQHPEHYALQAAREHDYLRFYSEEVQHREALNYPPYCRLVNLQIRDRKEPVAQQAADRLLEELVKLGSQAELLGPAPAPHSRVRGQYRYQIVLKGTTQTLAPCLDYLRYRRLPKAFLTVDIDPADLL